MNPCCPPFTQPCDACDEAEVRGLVAQRSDWRRIASHCGVHPHDMAHFIFGTASLTHENRRQIRARMAQEGHSLAPGSTQTDGSFPSPDARSVRLVEARGDSGVP